MKALQELTHILDYVMPGIKKMFNSWNEANGKEVGGDIKKHGLRHIKLHGTWHSSMSWLLSQGVPLHIVQARAGHQAPKITLSVYSHVAKDDENLVADLLDEKLFKKAASKYSYILARK